jgi:hypothetical protein
MTGFIEGVLHPRLHAFARHWGFRIRACAPYHARTTDEIEEHFLRFGAILRSLMGDRAAKGWV